MDEKRLEQEYRKLKRQETPDLWNRIEANLKDFPERSAAVLESRRQEENRLKEDGNFKPQKINGQKLGKFLSRRQMYGMAAAAAMVIVFVSMPKLFREQMKHDMWKKPLAESNGQEAGTAMVTGGDTDMAPPMAVPEAEAAADEEIMPETRAGMPSETAMPEFLVGMPGDGAVPENGAGMPDKGAVPESGAGLPDATDTSEMPPFFSGGSRQLSEDALSDGVLNREQLKLTAYRPLALPDDVVSVPEDSWYFSEAILKDTQLLCGGTVASVALEEDASGKTAKVVYEIVLDQVYFSEDYVTGMDEIVVKSPIIRTGGDEAYVLYQLQPGGTYLLPLQKPEADWELLYPFAPQIQVTNQGGYLFHTGYKSLVNQDTWVVVGQPEGENDYYYDRMVFRKDEEFLAEFLTLVEH